MRSLFNLSLDMIVFAFSSTSVFSLYSGIDTLNSSFREILIESSLPSQSIKYSKMLLWMNRTVDDLMIELPQRQPLIGIRV